MIILKDQLIKDHVLMYAHVYGYMKCSGILKRGNFLKFYNS